MYLSGLSQNFGVNVARNQWNAMNTGYTGDFGSGGFQAYLAAHPEIPVPTDAQYAAYLAAQRGDGTGQGGAYVISAAASAWGECMKNKAGPYAPSDVAACNAQVAAGQGIVPLASGGDPRYVPPIVGAVPPIAPIRTTLPNWGIGAQTDPLYRTNNAVRGVSFFDRVNPVMIAAVVGALLLLRR